MIQLFVSYAALIPIIPLLAFIILVILHLQARWAGPLLGIGTSAIALVHSLIVLMSSTERLPAHSWTWLEAGAHKLTVGVEVTPLSMVMLVVVTIVSFLVNIYTTAYMRDDERSNIFFGYIALFTASMLGLVIAADLLTFYIFWELVGVCSFLLIGFWYTKEAARAAAKKAFIVTRIGDVALLIAIIALYVTSTPSTSLTFTQLPETVSQLTQSEITWISIFIFIGAAGKSGQFPFHVWLPDAMEGPTPISALIHAATMVAAGVYLVVNTFPIFEASAITLDIVTYTGAFTAIFAAVIALKQTDIKRILAYSTISQLGYMMVALGLGSVGAAMFHLATHAFFKALLFLAAGIVIHLAHTQNIHEMGGLFYKNKLVAMLFAIGALALAGMAPFSGFWSKEAILNVAFEQNTFIFIVMIATALLTSLYMARLYFLVFFVDQGEDKQGEQQVSKLLWVPVAILSLGAIFAGYINLPWNPWLNEWLHVHVHAEQESAVVAIASIALSMLGIYLGWLIFIKKSLERQTMNRFNALLLNGFYMDRLMDITIVGTYRLIGQGLLLFDSQVVGQVTTSVQSGFSRLSQWVRKSVSGNLQTYALVTLICTVILLLVLIAKGWNG